MMETTIKPLAPDLLGDYLRFFDTMVFEENPGWSACYCFSFFFTGPNEQWNKENNRRSVTEFIKAGKMTGYLAYSDDVPVGWCNVNNRLNYPRLLKYYDLIDNPADKVCSVVCFLIKPEYRRQGIARKMLEQICADCSANDYDYIEAYPGKGKLSCERLYKGPLELYLDFGFSIEKEFDDYVVVRKKIESC
jgi:ribosomal protein S18 acetylase RimI-like enzyme